MSKAWEKIKAGFDEPVEWMAWLCFVAGLLVLAFRPDDTWWATVLFALAAITVGGVARFRGLKIGAGGIEVSGDAGQGNGLGKDEGDM